MSDIVMLVGIVALGGLFIAVLEWGDQIPPPWVVKTRLWLHRRRRNRL